MTSDRFAEFKSTLSQSGDYESFQESMKTLREGRRAERQSMREKITHSVENIANGVVKTITSDDTDVVAQIQSRGVENAPRNENVTRTVENLSNGIKVTTTSDDSEIVERMQNYADKKGSGEGMGQGQGRGKRHGNMNGNKGGGGQHKQGSRNGMGR